MQKLKNFLHTILIKSGFLGGVLGLILTPIVFCIPIILTGLITYSLLGFDIIVETTKFQKIFCNGLFVDILLLCVVAVVIGCYKLIKFIWNAWLEA